MVKQPGCLAHIIIIIFVRRPSLLCSHIVCINIMYIACLCQCNSCTYTNVEAELHGGNNYFEEILLITEIQFKKASFWCAVCKYFYCYVKSKKKTCEVISPTKYFHTKV